MSDRSSFDETKFKFIIIVSKWVSHIFYIISWVFFSVPGEAFSSLNVATLLTCNSPIFATG